MRLLAALLVFCSLGFGEVVYSGYGLIAQIADGGGIQVEITLANLDPTISTYTLGFVDDNGNPLTLATNVGTGSVLTGTLAPGASVSIRTAGTAATATQGFAYLQTTGTIGGSAIFRISVAPWAGSEAMLPLDTWRNNHFVLAFDHTGSTVTGLAVVNPSPTDTIPVTVTFKDQNGNVIVSSTFNMGPRTHQSIVTTTAYPATIGQRGTIEMSTTASYMSVLGLRFGPSTVSSVLPLISSQWAAAPGPTDPYNNSGPGSPYYYY